MGLLLEESGILNIPEHIQKVLNDFIVDIKNSKYIDYIQSVMLFGPLAKGVYDENNEIDFFVVKKENPEGLDKFLDQLSQRISARYGKAILVLDRDLSLYKNPVYQHTVFYKVLQDESILLYESDN